MARSRYADFCRASSKVFFCVVIVVAGQNIASAVDHLFPDSHLEVVVGELPTR